MLIALVCYIASGGKLSFASVISVVKMSEGRPNPTEEESNSINEFYSFGRAPP